MKTLFKKLLVYNNCDFESQQFEVFYVYYYIKSTSNVIIVIFRRV